MSANPQRPISRKKPPTQLYRRFREPIEACSAFDARPHLYPLSWSFAHIVGSYPVAIHAVVGCGQRKKASFAAGLL